MCSMSFKSCISSWLNTFFNVHVKPLLSTHVLRFTASSIYWDELNCSFGVIPHRMWWKDSFGSDEHKFLQPSKNFSLPNLWNIGSHWSLNTTWYRIFNWLASYCPHCTIPLKATPWCSSSGTVVMLWLLWCTAIMLQTSTYCFCHCLWVSYIWLYCKSIYILKYIYAGVFPNIFRHQ